MTKTLIPPLNSASSYDEINKKTSQQLFLSNFPAIRIKPFWSPNFPSQLFSLIFLVQFFLRPPAIKIILPIFHLDIFPTEIFLHLFSKFFLVYFNFHLQPDPTIWAFLPNPNAPPVMTSARLLFQNISDVGSLQGESLTSKDPVCFLTVYTIILLYGPINIYQNTNIKIWMFRP